MAEEAPNVLDSSITNYEKLLFGDEDEDYNVNADDQNTNRDGRESEGKSSESDAHTFRATENDKAQPIHQRQLSWCPYPTNDNLFTCKLPPALAMASRPFDKAKEREFLKSNPHLLDKPISDADVTMIRWSLNQPATASDDNDGDITFDHKNANTNTHLVEFDDGSMVLYVGSTPLDCDAKKETVFLLEDSNDKLKAVHAIVKGRITTKFSNLLKSESVFKKYTRHNRQKMALTTIAEATTAEMLIQKQLLISQENERLKRLQQSSQHQPRGLTRTFLESDSESE